MKEKAKYIDLEKEKEWIEQAKKNIQSFQPLYERYFDVIFRYIFRRTDNQVLTSDLTSQTFYQALSSIKSYKWKGKPFIAWLYVIAQNEIKKHFRSSGKEVFLIETEQLVFTEESEEWPTLQKKKLEAALRELNLEELELLELKYLEGYTFGEICIILDKSESAIKMKLYRLIEKIKGIIEDTHV